MTPSSMHTVRHGNGQPVVLVPGLGATGRSWDLVRPGLEAQREVITVDLPGFGQSAPLDGEVTIDRLADALVAHLEAEGLSDADLVGSSLGARLVLELARRGVGRHVVALDPGGFWTPRQVKVFGASLKASIALVRSIQPVLPALVGNPVGRTALLSQFSARPWALPADLVLTELRGYTAPGMFPTLQALVDSPPQQGAPVDGTPGRVAIGWGEKDRVTLPSQAAAALRAFPGASMHWFADCGHFPLWDKPQETVQLVLDCTR